MALTETPSKAKPSGTSSKPVHRSTLQKGQQTRATILEAALALASSMGLEGLSIGALAEVTQMLSLIHI